MIEKLKVILERFKKAVEQLQLITLKDKDYDSEEILKRFTIAYDLIQGKLFDKSEIDKLLKFQKGEPLAVLDTLIVP